MPPRGRPPLSLGGPALLIWRDEKQLHSRLPPHVVRRQIERFNSGESSWKESCDVLGVSRARLYTLRHEWLKDRDGFVPGLSGGDRSGEWPRECEALALELLTIGPVNFALIADEMDSRFGFRRSRAAVRDYLAERFPLLVQAAKPGPKPFRRWQCGRAGEIWQHDATPVRVWPSDRPQALIATIDDHTRQIVLASVFERETLWAHFTHLRKALVVHGIPEMLYTDGFSMFGHEGEDLATRCGRMLRALGIAHRIAPTPQAKGKIERTVGTLQRRLVPLLIREGVSGEAGCPSVVDRHVAYWNASHRNATTGVTPDEAWALAHRENRYAYRTCPHPSLLDLHIAFHEMRLVSPANTVAYAGRDWPVTPTLKKRLWLVVHPDKQFWVVDAKPDPLRPTWPSVLAHYDL